MEFAAIYFCMDVARCTITVFACRFTKYQHLFPLLQLNVFLCYKHGLNRLQVRFSSF
jgi:hypothetical protein